MMLPKKKIGSLTRDQNYTGKGKREKIIFVGVRAKFAKGKNGGIWCPKRVLRSRDGGWWVARNAAPHDCEKATGVLESTHVAQMYACKGGARFDSSSATPMGGFDRIVGPFVWCTGLCQHVCM